MARIVLGSYMVRYPLGGMLSWVLQYLIGFRQLGHEVWFVEKAGYAKACLDPLRGVMSDDCSRGVALVDGLLRRFGLEGRWCFVDWAGHYHGTSREQIEGVFASTDVFVDMGTHGAWAEEAERAGMRVFLDGEPGFRQIKMELNGELPAYDYWYTTGRSIGRATSAAPTAGRDWRPIAHPVVTELFTVAPPPERAPFTTVMNWQSHGRLEYRGASYGQKDVEFERFADLPRATEVPLELAVAGEVPGERLRAIGWRLRDAHEVTRSFDSFADYIRRSSGEFGVCKHVFVATRNGWFSDRSAAYLASGRPVVLQETGFSEHLPCGRGLFAVNSVEDAAAAIEEIRAEPVRHSRWAVEVAREHLEARSVLGRFLAEVGL
jgi:hypothetical protein